MSIWSTVTGCLKCGAGCRDISATKTSSEAMIHKKTIKQFYTNDGRVIVEHRGRGGQVGIEHFLKKIAAECDASEFQIEQT